MENLDVILTGTIILTFISAAEWAIQDHFCKSVKAYVVSILGIIMVNSLLTAVALSITFDTSIGAAAIFYLLAANSFPLFSGLKKIATITDDNKIEWEAQNFLESRGRK